MKKLFTGIILFAAFYYLNDLIGGADGIVKIEKYFRERLRFLPRDFSSILAHLVGIAIAFIMVYCFVSGLFRICTFNTYIPQFQDKSNGATIVRGHNSYPNINRVLSYRESKMAGMSSDRAADLYVSCSKIESLYTGYNSGSETQRVLSYVESKLSGMSSERGLNYLANKL